MGTTENPDWLESLDHTADAGIIVHAADLPQLFARAAWGMFSIITEIKHVRPAETLRIDLHADDLHALMVAWLSELNFRHITEHKLFSRFEVRYAAEIQLTAEVYGERIDPGRHTVFTEIKAVTFHGLEIHRANDSWRAQIIFDL